MLGKGEGGSGAGGYSQKNWVGVCGPLSQTLTLFMTKICDFSYPDQTFDTLFMT